MSDVRFERVEVRTVLAPHQRLLWRSISLEAFDVLWRQYQQGIPKPLVLECPSKGTTRAERARVERQAWGELEFSGFGRPGYPAPGVLTVLAELSTPVVELDLRVVVQGKRASGTLAVANRDQGLLAHLADGWFTLVRTTPGRIARDLVMLLPDHRPGDSMSQSVPVKSLAQADAALRADSARAADQPFTAVSEALGAVGCSEESRYAFAKLAGQPVLRRAELGSGRGRNRNARFLTVHDTPAERYLVEHQGEHVTMTGATRQVVERALVDLLPRGPACPWAW